MLKFFGKKAFPLIFVLMIMPRFAVAQGQPSVPDWKLAFVLATVSYCAYGLSSNGTTQDAKALRCLREAANKASPLLDELKVDPDSVEAYVDPEKRIDAYLLVRSTRGPILAFRGTLAPPEIHGFALIDLSKVDEFNTFVSDWVNDANLIGSDAGRYPGINASWRRLLGHLMADCAKGATDGQGGCSRFQQFLGNPGGKSQLFLTGHSKGGALATLATVEFSSNTLGGGGVDVTTYTFEAPKVFAPKALTPAAWSDVRERTQGLWRFEYKNDIVPLIPLGRAISDLKNFSPLNDLYQILQRTPFPFLTLSQDGKPLVQGEFYEAVGSLAYVDSDNSMIIAGLVPSESDRIDSYFGYIVGSFDPHPLRTLQSLCSAAVNRHFMIFVDVQRLAMAGSNGSLKIDEDGWASSFFAQGLGDVVEYMWGFKKRCEF